MGETFELDTSGHVPQVSTDGDLKAVIWRELDAFTQGYIEALFASVPFFHLECPSCEWDCIAGPPAVGDLGLTCPLCAGDSGRDVRLRTMSDLPDKVEGSDARPAFSDLAPEALARIIEDCAEALKDKRTGYYADSALSGRKFWQARQSQFQYWTDAHAYQHRHSFPPLTVSLGDDGKVYLSEPKSESLNGEEGR